MTYVSCLFASKTDENVVYACFDGRKNNDLKPYILKSTDKGASWVHIESDLPKRGTVYSILEDPVYGNMLFAGTEFGLYYSYNSGKNWIKFSHGLPTTAVRDIKVQEREDDLVIATFGRGFFILDDYSLLRQITGETLKQDHILFPVRDGLIYRQPVYRTKQGITDYFGKNPEFGVTFTYYMKDKIKTKKDYRLEAEKKAKEKGLDISYPSVENMREEADEIKPYLIFTIKNDDGKTIRRIKRSVRPGLHRFNWGLRGFIMNPVMKAGSPVHSNQAGGYLVAPGKYTVSMSKVVNGYEVQVGESQAFNLKRMDNLSLPTSDHDSLFAFKTEASKVYGITAGLTRYVDDMTKNVKALRTAFLNGSGTSQDDIVQIDEYLFELRRMKRILSGDEVIGKLNENQPPSLNSRIFTVVFGIFNGSDVTQTHKDNLEIVQRNLKDLIKQVKILDQKLTLLEKRANEAGCPWSPGRIPDFK
jgi:hypothetical protein